MFQPACKTVNDTNKLRSSVYVHYSKFRFRDPPPGNPRLGLEASGITIHSMHAQTRRQREVLDFIARYIESHGYQPSYQVIARHMGVSSRAGIARIVNDLETQGHLTRRRENGHFYIDIGKRSTRSETTGGILIDWLDVPVDQEESEEWHGRPFAIADFMLGGRDPASIRAFRVPDNAFHAQHICEDDIALIELNEFPRYGQMLVAVLDEERALLRKCYREGADIELHTAEEDGEIIRIAADRVEIKGIYRGLLRSVS